MEMEVVFPGGKKVDALFKGLRIQTDQPEESGGEGSAPAPFDLFLSSIGTCAGIYVLEFCRARDIPTDKLHLSVRFERNPERRMIETATIHIQLPPEFPVKYKDAVIRAADLCAVKKHLHEPPRFEITATIPDRAETA
jgi:putative redox protein